MKYQISLKDYHICSMNNTKITFNSFKHEKYSTASVCVIEGIFDGLRRSVNVHEKIIDYLIRLLIVPLEPKWSIILAFHP